MRMSTGAKKVLTKYAKAVPAAAKPTVQKKVDSLTRKVNKLAKVSYDVRQFRCNQDSGSAVTLPYYSYHINRRMDIWNPIFGSTATDLADVDKAYFNSYMVDARLIQDNEADRIFYTAFVVSLKDDANDATTFDPATGALTLAADVHYVNLAVQGKVMLNTKFFNIHSYKRFTMGGRAGDQSTPETKDLSFKVVPKQKLVVNPRGNVFANAAFTHPKDPSQNYYLLLFNDDSGADLQSNKIYVNSLATVSVAN